MKMTVSLVLKYIYLFNSFITAAELNIKSTDYRYPESIGDATVCVNTTKALSTGVNIRLNTSSFTAIGQ